MRIGLIDCDGHNYPNIPLMKLSAWHKANGDSVHWYDMFTGHCDRVYMAKVFSFTADYPYAIDADEIIKGGSGYAISTVSGKEVYDKSKDTELPAEIEHSFPDYALYPEFKDTAYGFLTRGCPRGCKFCHVAAKEGKKTIKAADLDEFWNGQKDIVLCDPNILACSECENLLQQLIDSKARINFNQGLDIRLLTEKTAAMLMQCKVSMLHFAWDRNEDLTEYFQRARKWLTKFRANEMKVYVLTNFDTTQEFDLYRIYKLRDMGFDPYMMIYDKKNAGRKYTTMQRWCNCKWVFRKVPDFRQYLYREECE